MVAAFVVAHPRRWLLILTMAIVLAGALELAQDLTASRHGTWHDASVKATGCGLGAVVGMIAEALYARFVQAAGCAV